MAYRAVATVLGGAIVGFAAMVYADAVASAPPSSIGPDVETQAVRVSHQHQMVVDCRHVVQPPGCVAELRDSDTATTVAFVARGGESSAPRHVGAPQRLTLPHLPGPQEQVAPLQIGQWLIDWRGAPRLERLEVRADKHLKVALTTVTGACVESGGHCQLVSGVRERSVSIIETAR